MSRNIESVASIFLEQIHGVKRDLENVKHVKESWVSQQATSGNKEEYFNNGGYEIDELISDLEDDAIRESRRTLDEDDQKEDSMEDIYNLSGTLTSDFEIEVQEVKHLE